MLKHYWISTPAYTVCVDVNALGTIVKAAPILHWAVGMQFQVVCRRIEVRFGNDVETVELKVDNLALV